jgi:hypothetical protein
MHNDEKRRQPAIVKTLVVAAFVACVAALVWGSDRITMQGERTIYTVECSKGNWNGKTCSGKLVPGKRYGFRASKARHEVLYWVRGSEAPSGRYTDCSVTDRDNWSCNVTIGPPPVTIAYEMIHGRPTHAGVGLALPFHSVPKWKWWLLDIGLGTFTECAD